MRLRTRAGAKSNMLTFRIKGKYYYYVNMMAAQSRIMDQNMAEGITELIKNNVLLKTQYGIILKAKTGR